MNISVKFAVSAFVLLVLCLFGGCTPNYNRSLVEHSISVYQDSVEAYNKNQKEYFDLLESLEIASDDELLDSDRRELKKDLEIRRLELHNMQVLIDEEIQQWEKQVFENRQELKVIEKATEDANQRLIKRRFQEAVEFK